jgi:biopolymer transport protein ExbB/TolQ
MLEQYAISVGAMVLWLGWTTTVHPVAIWLIARAWRRRRSRSLSADVFGLSVLALAAAAIGTVAGIVKALLAIDRTGATLLLDERMLEEGLAQAMAFTAMGVVVLVPAVALVLCAWRQREDA